MCMCLCTHSCLAFADFCTRIAFCVARVPFLRYIVTAGIALQHVCYFCHPKRARARTRALRGMRAHFARVFVLRVYGKSIFRAMCAMIDTHWHTSSIFVRARAHTHTTTRLLAYMLWGRHWRGGIRVAAPRTTALSCVHARACARDTTPPNRWNKHAYVCIYYLLVLSIPGNFKQNDIAHAGMAATKILCTATATRTHRRKRRKTEQTDQGRREGLEGQKGEGLETEETTENRGQGDLGGKA